MATWPPGTRVDLTELAADSLRFVPPDGDLVVVVHPAALRSPGSRHTQVAQLVAGEVSWLGAVGEDLLVRVEGPEEPGARAACSRVLLEGDRLWEIVRPGSLLVEDVERPLSTVYAGSRLRPWLIIGATSQGEPVAVPLGDASSPKWWTPIVPSAALRFEGNVKDAQVELAHAWTLPAELRPVGRLMPAGVRAVETTVRTYFA